MTLSRWMAKRKLTGLKVAKMAGIPQATLSRFLTGTGMPSAKNLQKLVGVTRGQVSLTELIREGEKKHGEKAAAEAEVAA